MGAARGFRRRPRGSACSYGGEPLHRSAARSGVKLFTIGFTQKTAKQFFGLLKEAGVRRVLDIRLNNRSQLAGFSKADDLPFFLDAIAGIGYRYAGEMAP